MQDHQEWVHKGISEAKSAFEAHTPISCRQAFEPLWAETAAHDLDHARTYEQFRSGWLNAIHDMQSQQPDVELWPGAFDV